MEDQNKQMPVMAAIYLVILVICSLVSIPLGPVPFTLQTFAITLIAYCATPRQATIAICTYMILGAIGVPIFASMRGGIGVLIGPSGGFLWGYALSVPLITYLVSKARQKLDGALLVLVQFIAGIAMSAIAYTLGTLQYMAVGGVEFIVAIIVTVLPFVLIDIVKISVALGISFAIKKFI